LVFDCGGSFSFDGVSEGGAAEGEVGLEAATGAVEAVFVLCFGEEVHFAFEFVLSAFL
jgi:hypothetical protein